MMKVVGKRKNIIVMIVLVVSMIIFTGCGNSVNKIPEPYKEIINKYAELVKNRENIDFDEIDSSFNFEMAASLFDNDDWNIYWTIKDIDGNGTDELLISGGFDAKDTINYEVYTLADNKAVELFSDCSFGHRTNFEVYEDGIIIVMKSSGANVVGHEYYQFEDDGNIEFIEMISTDQEIDMNTFESEIHFYEGATEISEDEWQAIANDYKEEGYMSFEWQDISEWVVETSEDDSKEEGKKTAAWTVFDENNFIGKSYEVIMDEYSPCTETTSGSGSLLFKMSNYIWALYSTNDVSDSGDWDDVYSMVEPSAKCIAMIGCIEDVFGINEEIDIFELGEILAVDNEFEYYAEEQFTAEYWKAEKAIDGQKYYILVAAGEDGNISGATSLEINIGNGGYFE